jgi:hypothetical protein
MQQTIQPPEGFMRGKSRHWFWGALAFLVFNGIVMAAFSTLFYQLFIRFGVWPALAASVVIRLGSMVFWMVILLGYGKSCTVRSHRTIFVVLACLALLGAGGGILSDAPALARSMGATVAQASVITALGSVLVAMQDLAWAACLLVILFGRRATPMLRISSGLLAAAKLFLVLTPLLLVGIDRLFHISSTSGGMLFPFVYGLLGLGETALAIFFFASLSFSWPKAKPIAAQVAGA